MANLSIKAINLISLDFRVGLPGPADNWVPPNIDIDYSFHDETTGVGSDRTLMQALDMQVHFLDGEGKRIAELARKPFHLEVRMLGKFGVPEGVETSQRDALATGAIAIMFPFLREAVFSIVQRSPYPPLLLPPTNLVAMRAAKHGPTRQ